MRVSIALGLSLNLVAGCSAAAQMPDPLSPPQGQLTCQRHWVVTGSPHNKRFGWTSEGGRLVDATYDSLGNPLRLATQAVGTGTGARAELMLVRFDSSSAAGLYGARIDSGVQAPREMTPAETARARELALWLWDRRCEGA